MFSPLFLSPRRMVSRFVLVTAYISTSFLLIDD